MQVDKHAPPHLLLLSWNTHITRWKAKKQLSSFTKLWRQQVGNNSFITVEEENPAVRYHQVFAKASVIATVWIMILTRKIKALPLIQFGVFFGWLVGFFALPVLSTVGLWLQKYSMRIWKACITVIPRQAAREHLFLVSASWGKKKEQLLGSWVNGISDQHQN